MRIGKLFYKMNGITMVDNTMQAEGKINIADVACPQFSFVVPVYNVASYLREFLDSLINQTIPDWEAICVDDGSTDGSGDILEEYSLRDKRFIVVHQRNAGVSSARNAGMERVRGKWFFIVDPDDILGCDYIHALYDIVKNEGNRVVVGVMGWKTFRDGESKEKNTVCRPLEPDGEYETRAAGFFYECGPLWCKIYPASMLSLSPRVRFSEGCPLGEDVVFGAQFLYLADKVVIRGGVNEYFYRLRDRSISHGFSRLQIAMQYWTSSLAINKDEMARRNPQILREYMIRAMYHHMVCLSVSDCSRVLRTMRNDGLAIWRACFVPEVEEDKKHRHKKFPYQYVYSQIYARIILSRLPVRVTAILLVTIDYWRRIAGRLRRLLHL